MDYSGFRRSENIEDRRGDPKRAPFSFVPSWDLLRYYMTPPSPKGSLSSQAGYYNIDPLPPMLAALLDQGQQ